MFFLSSTLTAAFQCSRYGFPLYLFLRVGSGVQTKSWPWALSQVICHYWIPHPHSILPQVDRSTIWCSPMSGCQQTNSYTSLLLSKTYYKLPIILKYCSLLLDTYNAWKNASTIYLGLAIHNKLGRVAVYYGECRVRLQFPYVPGLLGNQVDFCYGTTMSRQSL